MGSIEIKSLKYMGDKYYYKNDKFKKGLNILVGDNGDGKSTFTYLIVYALGAKVEWFKSKTKEPLVEILDDTNNYVELEVIINSGEYTLKRGIRDNFISVYSEKEEEIKSYSIGRNGYYYDKENITFSDWIFDKLNINLVEITQYASTHKINFDDVMRYIYYDQITDNNVIISEFGIDRNDRYKNSNIMKRSIFELIMSSYFKAFYDTYYKIKNLNSKLQEKKEYNNALVSLRDNIIEEADCSKLENIKEQLDRVQKEIYRIKNLREDVKMNNPLNEDEENYEVDYIFDIQKNIISKFHEQKNYEFIMDDLERKLSQFKKLYHDKEKEIIQIDKILFTANYIDIINEDKCPFCQEQLNLQENKCICGSDKSINFSRFIYSDKEYKDIMKSKVKSIKTIENTIKDYEKRYSSIKMKLQNTQNVLKQYKKKLKVLTKNIVSNSNFEIIEELTEEYFDLQEKERELNLIISKQQEVENSDKAIEKLNKNIKLEKDKLEKLKKEKDDKLQENLEKFEEIYSAYLINYYKNEEKEFIVKLDRNYTPFLNVYKEQSFTVPKKFFYYLTLLDMSIDNTLKINFPRFLIIDTIKDAGLEIEDLKKLMRYLENYEDSNCQIVVTCGYDEYSEEFKKYEIDHLSDSNMLLKKK
ncbi:AAA family ATPase [Clostridium sp. LCP25S3_F10]|uniref:AAA family ATPase n=1 Tax=Clostridium sp. LCP25S3_F10 TaxID=3438750 RepID=UPI003F92AB4C